MASSPGRLLAGERVVLVAGKGGVGKTTTAGALALALAEAGEPVELVSTDPAHSLRDLFALPPAAPAEACGGLVRIEEFDARAYAAGWSARAAPALSALVEAGTYLDADDARRFLDLSLPGIDEVMAALRLIELAGGERRIVVDTAPTGHTLRLLESGRVLSSWADALEAMAAKADAVARAFAAGAVPTPGAALVGELQRAARRFEDEVLPAVAAVVVTRAGGVVAAETARLLERLRARGVRVRAIVHTGDGADRSLRLAADAPVLHAALLSSPPRDCAGLRGWLDALRLVDRDAVREPAAAGAPAGQAAAPDAAAPDSPAPAAAAPDAAAAEWLERLPLRVLFFAGKGGVGKSTCAAAVALRLARSRPVLLLSTDPAGSLREVLDHDVGAAATTVAERLRARQIDAAAALEEMRADYERGVAAVFEQLGVAGGSATLDRRVADSLWNMAPPGMDEIAALVGLLEAAASEETIVVDAAPTGHFLRLLQLPQLALDWTHALMRVLLKFGAASLDGVAERLLAFAKQLKSLQHTLTDAERSGAFVVTLEEPMVQAETERLLAQLGAARVTTTALIVNRAAPDGARAADERRFARRTIAAPSLVTPPVGAAALAGFVERWTLLP